MGRCRRQYTSCRVAVISPPGMWKLLVSLCHLLTSATNNVMSRCVNLVLASPHNPVALIVWSHYSALAGTSVFKSCQRYNITKLLHWYNLIPPYKLIFFLLFLLKDKGPTTISLHSLFAPWVCMRKNLVKKEEQKLKTTT
jgi:hypothetical protein